MRVNMLQYPVGHSSIS